MTDRLSKITLLGMLLFLLVPSAVHAVLKEADAMCIPVKEECFCGVKKDDKGNCTMPGNKFMCECYDSTNKFQTMGKCTHQFHCEATGTSDGKLDAGMSKLGEMLSKLMEALKGKDGGGGGGSPTNPTDPNSCITMRPGTKDEALAQPQCVYEDPTLTSQDKTDPSGGLVATPTSGDAPLTVYFAFTNGSTGCGTPTLDLDFGDGEVQTQQTHTGTNCSGYSETTQHVFTADGQYAVRLKAQTSGQVRGGVNITVGAGAPTDPIPDNGTGTSTNVGTSVNTGGNATNVGATQFVTPLVNLTNRGTVSNSGRTGGTSLLEYVPATSASTGGSSASTDGAALNFNTPQSIVQSIIQKNLPPGAYGDVKIMENGTTIIAGVRENNTEVAGFFGTNAPSGQGTGAVSRLCSNRPWASNFLSYIIPPSFFDTLCSWRGYTVGGSSQQTTTSAVPIITKQPTTVKTTVGGSAKPATTTKPTGIPSKVEIWASPATVPLNARTSIFWSSQGVTECIVTSPDGSFTHSTLKGGASTVPLTAPTSFSISCLKPDGSHITDSVTVQIAI